MSQLTTTRTSQIVWHAWNRRSKSIGEGREKSHPLWQGSWTRPSGWWGSGTDRLAAHWAGGNMDHCKAEGSTTQGDTHRCIINTKITKVKGQVLKVCFWGRREVGAVSFWAWVYFFFFFLFKNYVCLTWISFQMQPDDMPLDSSKPLCLYLSNIFFNVYFK